MACVLSFLYYLNCYMKQNLKYSPSLKLDNIYLNNKPLPDIEVGGRFVEHVDVSFLHSAQRDCKPLQFTSAQMTHFPAKQFS